jgi:hypothetical protein
MVSVQTSQLPNTVQCLFVTDVAAKRVGGIRRIGDQPTGSYNLSRLADQPLLWIGRMN